MKTTNIRRSLAVAMLSLSIGLLHDSVQAQNTTQVSSDLLVGYTTRSKDARGGNPQMVAAIRQGIARANKANRDSRTNVYISSVGFLEFNYDDSQGNLRAHYNDWRNNRGGVSRGKAQTAWDRDTQADLMCLITRGGGLRGIAGLGGRYSCVTEGQTQFHTLGHEIGHNLDCGHSGGHAMATPQGQRFTFLASGGEGNGSIVDLYSNPFVKYQGKYTAGINPNKYNALRMFLNRNRAANFRTGLVDGSLISLKSSNNLFVASENGKGPMNANRTRIGTYERFRVRKNGNGWAFYSEKSNKKYFSSENGSDRGMFCNRDAIGPWEVFEQGTVGGKITLQGVGGYVSSEFGNRSMRSNRASASAWEQWSILRP